jgi:dual specificity phosphatase 3
MVAFTEATMGRRSSKDGPPMPTIASSDIATWHRQLCPLTDQLVISGDLPEDPDLAIGHLAQWQRAGITHILDTRYEWTDKELVAAHAPDITYGWFGTHDDGSQQPDEWFDSGLTFAIEALRLPDTMMLVHCHMGINRGPSMAYRILLELDWEPIEALDAIHNARPIAQIAYAADALDHYHRAVDVSPLERSHTAARLEDWINTRLAGSWAWRRTRQSE